MRANGFDAIGNIDTSESGTSQEGVFERCNATWNFGVYTASNHLVCFRFDDRVAIITRIINGVASLNDNTLQCLTPRESRELNRGYAAWYADARQPVSTLKCGNANVLHTIGESDTR